MCAFHISSIPDDPPRAVLSISTFLILLWKILGEKKKEAAAEKSMRIISKRGRVNDNHLSMQSF